MQGWIPVRPITMIFSGSRTIHPQSTTLTICGTLLKESDDLEILWVLFNFKMTVEKHPRSVSKSYSQRLGILRKSWRVFHDRSLLGKYSRIDRFLADAFRDNYPRNGRGARFGELFSVCCSAAEAHRELQDRVLSRTRFLTGAMFDCDIAHRRFVAVLYMLYKIQDQV